MRNTGERKSAAQKITWRGERNLWTKGSGAGLCWGDSGGPLMVEGQGKILGVLADFHGSFYCYSGNQMIFTSLAGERRFIEQAIECSTSADPNCRPCDFLCSEYGYAAGQCNQGWQCDDRCIEYRGSC